MTDLFPFALGLLIGMAALAGVFGDYIRNCGSLHCPHHRKENIRRLNAGNEKERTDWNKNKRKGT